VPKQVSVEVFTKKLCIIVGHAMGLRGVLGIQGMQGVFVECAERYSMFSEDAFGAYL